MMKSSVLKVAYNCPSMTSMSYEAGKVNKTIIGNRINKTNSIAAQLN